MSKAINLWRRALVLGLAVATLAMFWFLYWAPLPPGLRELGPLTTLYVDAKGRAIAELPGPDARSHRPVELAAMGRWISSFTASLEDRRFEAHPGVDLLATARALVQRRGGGSTITQQLIKLATGRKGRGLGSKVREMGWALQLERRWTKAQILEAYLNRVPYGNRLIGIEAAAQAYFNKPAALLNKSEAIYLAGLPNKPSRLNPWLQPDAAAARFARSRQRLLARGILSAAENAEMSPPPVGRTLPENAAPHFIQAVAVSRQRGTVACTLDLELQRRAQQLVREHLDTFRRPDITQAAMVVIENETGAVRAMVGSRDFQAGQINGALSFRACGSTLKPFLYLTGIDRGIFTAATLLPDTADAARDAYADYDPHNFVMTHLGPVRVREALGNSLNVPAVVAVSRIGARKAFEAIGEWGVRFDGPLEKSGAGFILGNAGVRLLDLTAAYAGLARGGLAGPPRLLAREVMPLRRVASAQAVEIVTDILCDNAARLQSFGPRSALAFPVRVGGKTGTSAGFRDAWAVGFTREHTVGVWVGNFDGRAMEHAAAVASAAPLWRRMMDDLLQTDHPMPEPTLPRLPVCALSGLLPCAKSPAKVAELFLPGTQPMASAADWFAPDGHPLLPREYAAWCASGDNHLKAEIRPDAHPLSIRAPREGAVFVLDDNLPSGQQQLEFQANRPEGTVWEVNGQPVAPRPDGRVLWPLAEGEWTVEATHAAERASHRFTVRKP